MRISVVTRDQSLAKCVRAILADLPHDLALADPRIPASEADLFIWDYSPEHGMPWLEWVHGSHHLLLVDPGNLSRVASFVAGMILIVKPFDKASLAAWLTPFLVNTQRRNFVQNDESQERQWSDFLAKTVHDLRAPLTAASGYCGLLAAEELGPLTDRQKEVLCRTQNSLARLARMTSEVLQRSAGAQTKGQSKAVRALPRKPCLEPGELDRCIEQAIQEVQLAVAQRDVRISGHVTPPARVIHFDKGQLEQVFSNLLENACKFTPVGGRIEVRGYPQGAGFFRVDVFNTGPGISPARLKRVFDEYASFGTGSGMGLGLAISKRIVEQHGGRIWAENEPGGLRMSFVLPVKSRSESLAS